MAQDQSDPNGDKYDNTYANDFPNISSYPYSNADTYGYAASNSPDTVYLCGNATATITSGDFP